MKKPRRLWLGDWQRDGQEPDESDTVRIMPVDEADLRWRAERRRKLRRGAAIVAAGALAIALGVVWSSGGDHEPVTAQQQQVPLAQAPQLQLPQAPQGAPPQGFGGPDLTGPAAAKAAAAALAKFPGDIERVTEGPAGGYVVHVFQADGTEVHVLVNDQFKVEGSDANSGPRNFGPGTSQ
jgi:hypothetical protein